ncbi:hypothetical protein [Methylomonas koyamae]|uniref:hypothetical protein n=1 Tax=Methylomonas koyamae TaxID=702114 RepID=UPI0006D20B13|nr:hypothetical protein [Methylomonas koyamae]
MALAEVLDAALRAFPGLLAAEQRKQVAEGELQTAEGGFDTLLKSQNRWSVAGIYENRNYDVVIEQPTSLWGATFFGGWRRGTGQYPLYEGKSQTADDGEAASASISRCGATARSTGAGPACSKPNSAN